MLHGPFSLSRNCNPSSGALAYRLIILIWIITIIIIIILIILILIWFLIWFFYKHS
jgi:hypothetical protein